MHSFVSSSFSEKERNPDVDIDVGCLGVAEHKVHPYERLINDIDVRWTHRDMNQEKRENLTDKHANTNDFALK